MHSSAYDNTHRASALNISASSTNYNFVIERMHREVGSGRIVIKKVLTKHMAKKKKAKKAAKKKR